MKSDGTATAVNWPAIASRASDSASFGSFLARSPDGAAALLGAITVHAKGSGLNQSPPTEVKARGV